MKILSLYPTVPWPLDRGTHQRSFHLLRALGERHEVDAVMLAEEGAATSSPEPFASFCREVEFLPFRHPQWKTLFGGRLLDPLPSNVTHWADPAVARRLQERIARERYDHIHLCDLILAPYVLKAGVPFSVDRSRVDLQYQWMEHRSLQLGFGTRLLRYENYAKLWRFERRIARAAAFEVVCGPDDEAFLRRYVARRGRIHVVGNGVDLGFFRPEAAQEPRDPEPTVLFCGAMDYNPNVDALEWFFREIHGSILARVPQLRVLIVGKNPVPAVQAYASLPGVTVTGTVPDVRAYYRRAWAQIVPLRIGGGTRLKIPESMAMGTPVVSTPIGAQGLELHHGSEALLAESADDFARETVRLLTDPALRAVEEQTGLAAARARFSWARMGDLLCQAFSSRFQP